MNEGLYNLNNEDGTASLKDDGYHLTQAGAGDFRVSWGGAGGTESPEKRVCDS